MFPHAPIIRYCWAALALVWLVGAGSTKPTLRASKSALRAVSLAALLLGFVLIGSDWGPRGLVWPPVPVSSEVNILAVLLTVVGCAFAIWARVALGRNWSGRPSVKSDHELITTGPYAVTRHPIYTGMLVAVIGTMLADLQWRSIAGTMLITFALLVKIHQEEHLMGEAFPQTYPRYKRRVKTLIPGVF